MLVLRFLYGTTKFEKNIFSKKLEKWKLHVME